MHVCWPVGAQTRHIRLSKLLQASHRRLEIVVWASFGWVCGHAKCRLGLWAGNLAAATKIHRRGAAGVFIVDGGTGKLLLVL